MKINLAACTALVKAPFHCSAIPKDGFSLALCSHSRQTDSALGRKALLFWSQLVCKLRNRLTSLTSPSPVMFKGLIKEMNVYHWRPYCQAHNAHLFEIAIQSRQSVLCLLCSTWNPVYYTRVRLRSWINGFCL